MAVVAVLYGFLGVCGRRRSSSRSACSADTRQWRPRTRSADAQYLAVMPAVDGVDCVEGHSGSSPVDSLHMEYHCATRPSTVRFLEAGADYLTQSGPTAQRRDRNSHVYTIRCSYTWMPTSSPTSSTDRHGMRPSQKYSMSARPSALKRTHSYASTHLCSPSPSSRARPSRSTARARPA